MRGQDGRAEIRVAEHEEILLPADVLRPDGTFDLYEDVQTKFEIEYKRKVKRLVIRAGGWVGRVPINAKYALRIATRVPVSSLERVVQRAAGARVEVLNRYRHGYGDSADRAQSLDEIVTEHFLASLDLIWQEGLAKTYRRKCYRSASPVGRLDVYRTALATAGAGRPIAHFSYFRRTEDYGPNRLLRSALQELIMEYSRGKDDRRARARCRRLRQAAEHLRGVGFAAANDRNQRAAEGHAEALRRHRRTYADPLRVAGLICERRGIALRGREGSLTLPVILIDMADVFERYVRDTLKRIGRSIGGYEVLDGNVWPPTGAGVALFDRLDVEAKNPNATPDIVIRSGEQVVAVVDVKYKPAKAIPQRSELNQIVCYGERYGAPKVMIVYPEASAGEDRVCSVGTIGATQVFKAHLDLGRQDLQAEEELFARQLFDSLTRHSDSDAAACSL